MLWKKRGHGEAAEKVWPSRTLCSKDLCWKTSVTPASWPPPAVVSETIRPSLIYVATSTSQRKVQQAKPLKKPIIKEKPVSDLRKIHFRFLGTRRRARFLPYSWRSALCRKLWGPPEGPILPRGPCRQAGRQREQPGLAGEYTRSRPLLTGEGWI